MTLDRAPNLNEMGETRRFRADELREVSYVDGSGKSVVFKAQNGVIEVPGDSLLIPNLETLASDPEHPLYEAQPEEPKTAAKAKPKGEF